MDNRKINFIVIGNSQSGKSALVQRYTTNRFQELYSPTIGVDFDSRCYSNGLTIQIWDTCGQDTKSIKIWGKSAHVAICIYSSLGSTMEWINELNKNCQDNVLLALVVTKKDLIYPPQFNKTAHDLSKQLNCLYFEVSALTGVGIDHLFETCIETKFRKDHDTQIVTDATYKTLLEPMQKKEICCNLF